MDKYDLYGKMAIPKKHNFEHEVPALYRIAAEKRGVFINPALTEPFGLTLLEASASGVPIVATNDGGPNDIIRNCKSGILVNPTQPEAIATALKKIITNSQLWERYSKNGILKVREYYTWKNHARIYSSLIKKLLTGEKASNMDTAKPTDAIGRRLHKLNYLLVTDIDNTLLNDDNSRLEELLDILNRNRERIGFGVATGRTIDSARAILARFNIPTPDFIISSVGSEIYYGSNEIPEQGWSTHIAAHWQRDKIEKLLEDFEYLQYQEEATQRLYKISYYMQPGKDQIAKIHSRLRDHKCRYNLIYSHDEFLDILPFRASKGKAIRYLSYKWEIPLKNFLVCGDSGNDKEMLRGEPCAVVVGNYSHELDALKGGRNVFFAKSPCAGGIIEGLQHYQFVETSKGN
jgi:sucrose-phosphate synthase